MAKEVVKAQFKALPGDFTGESEGSYKNIRIICLTSGRDSKQSLPECKFDAVPMFLY
jgi:hypothetical protein